MGFFGQRWQKGHVKAASSAVHGPIIQQQPHSHEVDRPYTAPAQHFNYDSPEKPHKPPRPHRAEPVYSFPPPPPLWDRQARTQEDADPWMAGHTVTTGQPLPALLEHPAFRQPIRDDISVFDVVGDKLSEIISLIDEDAYIGPDRNLIISLPSPNTSSEDVTPTPATADSEKTLVNFTIPQSRYRSKSTTYQQPQRAERTINFLNKVSYYANSRLPPSLPPFRVYIPTWPLFCLAAQYSSTAYQNPSSSDWSDQDSAYIPSNTVPGSKAMVIKSVPCDSKKTIVFAIRGTSVLSLRDWNTNLNTTPKSPVDYLDDAGNLCHAGFLRVAKAMVKPIATRLRQLLEQNPSRSECSLLITGHSAGGAVASLLYAHMLSQTVQSELTILTSCFKRVHCVTFGAPPVSLLPLSKPANADAHLKKCLFHSFMNEGDPVVRAEKSYVRSLVELVATQLPTPIKENSKAMDMVAAGLNKLDLSILPSMVHVANESKRCLETITNHPFLLSNSNNTNNTNIIDNTLIKKPNRKRQGMQLSPPPPPPQQQKAQLISSPTVEQRKVIKSAPTWPLPHSTLSNAGRLVVLRIAPHHQQDISPHTTSTSSPTTITKSTPFSPQITSSPSQSASTTANLRHEFDTVRAEIVSDEQLRGVVFGDPLMHAMDVYRRRVEALAMKAVTGRNTFYT